MSELSIDGRLVATLDFRASYSRDDHVMIFRPATGWSVLVVSSSERHDEDGNLTEAKATAYVELVDDVAGLKELAKRRGWDWWTILDHGSQEDTELYAASVPERMRRDLDASSLYNKDLAVAAGYFGPEIPSAGRALPDWQVGAVAAMCAHLDQSGWLVRGAGPRYQRREWPNDDPVLGVLEAWRYGHAAAIVVRVDCCGEIFARLPDEADVAGPVLRPLSDDEEVELSDELHRRRYDRLRDA